MIVGALIMPALWGWALMWGLDRAARGSGLTWDQKLFLGPGLGLGLAGWLFFLVYVLARQPAWVLWFLEAGLTVAALLVLFSRRWRSGFWEGSSAMTWRPSRLNLVLTGAFTLAMVLAAWAYLLMAWNNPHGGWDAWSFWQLKAKHLLVSRDCLTSALTVTAHPGYPLLWPSLMSRGWLFTGTEGTQVPLFLSALLTVCALGAVISSVRSERGWSLAALCGLVLMGSQGLFRPGHFQYADTPLAYYLLISVVALRVGSRCRGPIFFFISGLAAGLALWTKEEGFLFALAILAVLIIFMDWRGWGRTGRVSLAAFVIGVGPFLITALMFRLSLGEAGVSVFFSGRQPGEMWALVADPARILTISEAFIKELFTFHRWGYMVPPLILLILATGLDRRGKTEALPGILALTIILAGFISIYLITPHDLEWHLNTSLSRLFVQLYPSGLFLYFTLIRNPFDRSLGRSGGLADRGPGGLTG